MLTVAPPSDEMFRCDRAAGWPVPGWRAPGTAVSKPCRTAPAASGGRGALTDGGWGGMMKDSVNLSSHSSYLAVEPGATPVRNLPYKWIVATIYVCGLFMDIMDSTIVNVALPTFGRTFHAGNTTLEWVLTGYLLSLAVWVPASGWVGDRFGTKKTFMFALAMFTASSALCGLSWNIGS